MFDKGVEELSSSVPSSLGRTPTSIPLTFQGAASALPTDQHSQEVSESPRSTQVLSPSDPRSAALIAGIKDKVHKIKSSQSAPPPRMGNATARSTIWIDHISLK